MKHSNFRPYNLNQNNKKTVSIDKFLGIDLTNPIFSIANGRAIDLMDCIHKNEKVQSRNGITQIFKVTPYRYIKRNFDGSIDDVSNIRINDVNVNSIWSFKAEDNQQHIIAHIGKLLYEIKNIEDEEEIRIEPIVFPSSNTGYNSCYEYENFKSMAFVNGKKLWFLGGNKYMVIRYIDNNVIITPVEDSDLVPIPTTTINIIYQNSIVTDKRAGLDKVNLLTKWRKNMLLSGTGKSNESTSTEYYDYTLDAPLISKDEETLKKDMSQFEMIIEERGVITNG